MNFIIFVIVTLQLSAIFVKSSFILNDELNRRKRWALSNRSLLWPSNVIHYKISCPSYTSKQIALIKTSFDELMTRTCLKITEIDDSSDQTNFIDIRCNEGGSCKSKLGYKGGAQLLNLEVSNDPNSNQNCLSRRKIHHEFLHTIGFEHEHTNPNRDEFLELAYDNMKSGWDEYFAKDLSKNLSSYGCEFDYNSVMMPPAYKHSKNGLATLIPKDNAYTPDQIGIADGASDCDIIRVNNIYCTK